MCIVIITVDKINLLRCRALTSCHLWPVIANNISAQHTPFKLIKAADVVSHPKNPLAVIVFLPDDPRGAQEGHRRHAEELPG